MSSQLKRLLAHNPHLIPHITPSSPEQDLWLSVLVQALYNAIRKNDLHDQLWLASQENHIGSFNWICESCDLDSAKLMEYLSTHSLRPLKEQPQKFIQGFYHHNTRPPREDRVNKNLKKPRIHRAGNGIYKTKKAS